MTQYILPSTREDDISDFQVQFRKTFRRSIPRTIIDAPFQTHLIWLCVAFKAIIKEGIYYQMIYSKLMTDQDRILEGCFLVF
jgi:hypothetical protein